MYQVVQKIYLSLSRKSINSWDIIESPVPDFPTDLCARFDTRRSGVQLWVIIAVRLQGKRLPKKEHKQGAWGTRRIHGYIERPHPAHPNVPRLPGTSIDLLPPVLLPAWLLWPFLLSLCFISETALSGGHLLLYFNFYAPLTLGGKELRPLVINDGHNIWRKTHRNPWPWLLNIPSNLKYISLALEALDVHTFTYIPYV